MNFIDNLEIARTQRNLPHWKKARAIYWLTFRLADSIPSSMLKAWKKEYDAWQCVHPQPWDDKTWEEYDERFGSRLEKWMDAGMGSCALGRADVREEVRRSLTIFDNKRLALHAAVIMPTHVHCLIEPFDGFEISKLMMIIKSASARNANKRLGQTGTFWQDESYDHIVRSDEQYAYLMWYVRDNPVKARLGEGTYWLYVRESSFATGYAGVPPA